MKLHQDKILFKEAVTAAAQLMVIPEIYVEKDYWVTYALHHIFADKIGDEVVFKGGTALSKCFSVIERFSEDIDLVVLKNEEETDNQLKRKIRKISKSLEEDLPEIKVDGITNKKGMIRKTAHQYPKVFSGEYGQVREAIIIEASWLGSFEPFENRQVISFIGQMMLDNNQSELAEKYGMTAFDVRALKPTRTICEKIMSLIRFSYSENPIADLRNKIRHIYDLHQLLKNPEFLEFFESNAFEQMLIKVGREDINSFRNNNDWLNFHPKDALLFKEVEKIWEQIQTSYNGNFKLLVYGNLPNAEQIVNTLKMIQERLKQVSWTINTKDL